MAIPGINGSNNDSYNHLPIESSETTLISKMNNSFRISQSNLEKASHEVDNKVNPQQKNYKVITSNSDANEITSLFDSLDFGDEINSFGNETEEVVEEKEQVIEEKEQVIEEKEQLIEEKEQVIEEKEQVIEEKEQLIEEKTEAVDTESEAIEKIDQIAEEKNISLAVENKLVKAEKQVDKSEKKSDNQELQLKESKLKNVKKEKLKINQSSDFIQSKSADIDIEKIGENYKINLNEKSADISITSIKVLNIFAKQNNIIVQKKHSTETESKKESYFIIENGVSLEELKSNIHEFYDEFIEDYDLFKEGPNGELILLTKEEKKEFIKELGNDLIGFLINDSIIQLKPSDSDTKNQSENHAFKHMKPEITMDVWLSNYLRNGPKDLKFTLFTTFIKTNEILKNIELENRRQKDKEFEESLENYEKQTSILKGRIKKQEKERLQVLEDSQNFDLQISKINRLWKRKYKTSS